MYMKEVKLLCLQQDILGKWFHFLEFNLCQLKQSYNSWICKHAVKWVVVENGIVLLEDRLAA